MALPPPNLSNLFNTARTAYQEHNESSETGLLRTIMAAIERDKKEGSAHVPFKGTLPTGVEAKLKGAGFSVNVIYGDQRDPGNSIVVSWT